jgi:O-Antigen ligase
MGLTATGLLRRGSFATTERRVELAALSRTAALFALSGAIVLSPFRARIVLDARPLPPVFSDYRDFLLFWNEILIIAVLAFWGLSLFLRPKRIDLGPLLITVPVVILASAVFISTPFAIDGPLAIFNSIAIVGFILLGLFVLNEVDSISRVVPAIGVMILVQAFVAIGQVLSQSSFGLSSLGELHLDANASGVSILWTRSAPTLLRAYGLSDHPNILGGVLAASLLVFAAAFVRLRDGALVVACAVFGLGVAAVLVTFSRSAALGLAAGVAFVLITLLARRDWRGLSVWLTACLAALLIAAPLLKPYSAYLGGRVNPTAQPVGSPEERALSEREALARVTNDIFVDHALAGVGAGVLPTAMRDAYPDFGYDYAPAHTVILVVAAETGLFGAFAYGTLMLTPWLLIWLRRKRLTPELIGVSGAFLALEVVGLLDYYTWSLTAGRIWFWLVLGLWVVAYRRAVEQPADA